MGQVGSAYDNSVAETFFATLKKELVYRRSCRPERRSAPKPSNKSKASTTAAEGTATSAGFRPPSSRTGHARSSPNDPQIGSPTVRIGVAQNGLGQMKLLTLSRRIFDPRFAGASRSSTALGFLVGLLAGAAVLTTGNLTASLLILLGSFAAVALPCRFVFREQQLFSQEVRELWGLAGVMLDGRPWPPPGGWALGADAMALLIREIRFRGAQSVVELGPGTSSIVLGRAFPDLNFYGIEHDGGFLDQLRKNLEIHELADYELIHGPLVPTELDGAVVHWYENSVLGQLPAEIDVLIVDGPPNWKGQGNRSPAWPRLRDRVADAGLILIDDTNRSDERAMAMSWLKGSEELRLLTDEGHFMVLEVTKTRSEAGVFEQ